MEKSVFDLLIPSLIVLIGWFVVSRQNDKRETRKEVRQCLDRTIASIEAISTNAINYYISTDKSKDYTLSLKLTTDLFRLEKNLKIIALKDSKKKEITALTFRSRITGRDDFQTSTRKNLPENHPDLYQIKLESEKLIAELEQSYKDKYH